MKGLVLISPLATLGASVISGDGWKLLWASRTMSLGSTYWSATQKAHREPAQALMGFRHAGHCWAPRTMLPPRLGATVVELDGAGPDAPAAAPSLATGPATPRSP